MKKYHKRSKGGYCKLLTVIFIAVSIVAASFQFAVAKSNENAGQSYEKHVSGQLIVKFKEGTGPDVDFLKSHNALSAKKILKADKTESKASKSFKKFGIDRIYLIDLSGKSDIVKAIKDINNDSRIEYAEPNYIYHTTEIPNDPNFSELWGLHNTGQNGGIADADIDAPEAWDTQTGSSSVVIAVIDTGVDYTHPDLAGNIWTNLGEIAGNGIDDDGNGFVDDIHGYDFVNNDGDPMDDHYHGTHCAGTIGAVGNDNIGIVGVNWSVSIMPVKFLSASGSGSTLDAIASVEYATLMGADIMSNSWGGGSYSQALEDAISAANDAKVLFVAAAGNSSSNNDTSPHYPSSYDVPNVIAVAATDRNDNKASFSCYGAASVDLGAPGVSIYSTKPDNTYGALSGTSMACPHVAGAAGLIKAQYPLLTGDEIKTRLFGGVDPIPSMDGITVTGGRLNIYNSLDNDSISPATVSTLETVGVTYNTITLSWVAVGDDGNTGTASSYDVRYSTSEITEANWNDATKAIGEPNPQIASSTETFEVTGLEFDTMYHFALKAVDNVGNISGLSNSAFGTTLTPIVVFEDDMESGINGWAHSGIYDNWELGVLTSGPGSSYSGSNAWATNINGDYGIDQMNAGLLSPSVNLTGVESAQLTFQHYYYTESYYDGAIVEISVDGGTSWAQITPNGGYPEDSLYSGNPLGPVPAYSGYSGAGWYQAVFDISNYDGYDNVNIRFRFGTDYSVNEYPGWYIDDVVIFGQGNWDNIPPTANAGADQIVNDADGDEEETVIFNGSGSYDPDGNIDSYTWLDADLSLIGSGISLEHSFSIGTHTVTLVVEDNEGASSTDEVVIIINPNQAPSADAGPEQSSLVGNEVIFDGSGSYDPDGSMVAYEWDFDDSDGIGVDATGDTVSHSYAVAGEYTATLIVTDNGGATTSDTVRVIVENQISEDSVEITNVLYDAKKDTLTIIARSSAGSEAVLTATAGDFIKVMKYDSRLEIFKVIMRKVVSEPSSVIVTSSFGGTDTYPD